jgi:hypothetical protein
LPELEGWTGGDGADKLCAALAGPGVLTRRGDQPGHRDVKGSLPPSRRQTILQARARESGGRWN